MSYEDPPPAYLPPPPGYAPAPPAYSPVGTGYSVVPAPDNSKWAVASLVCSLLGLCTGFTAILGIIFGHMALSEIKKSNMILQGRGLAIAGLVIGYTEVRSSCLVSSFWWARPLARPLLPR
jgi:Domain of unknown function (DUF4190)